MATDLSRLVLRLEADNAKLVSSLEKTTRQLQGFQRSTLSITSSVRTALTGLGVGFSTAALVRSLGTTIDFADNMGKLSQKTGVAVEELSALNYAAQLSDVSTDSLATAFKKLAVNQSDALKGTGEAKDAFAAIGITLADLKTKSPDQLLKQIADRFASYEDGANKAALAVKLLGRAGTELIPLLNQGSAGIASAEAEARRFGATIDENTAAAAERFNDQIKKLDTSFTGFKLTIATDILPSLNAMTKAFTEAYTDGFTLSRFMDHLREEGGGGKFADPSKVFNADALRDNLRELEKEYDATQQKLAKGFYFDTDTKELNIPAANQLALDALGKQIIDTKSQLRDLIGMQTPVNNVGKELLKLNDYWQLNAISTKEYIALVQKAAGVKVAAPEIKDTNPTKAEKALESEIEKIQEANKKWQEGILTVQQYHDAVRQAADLPNSIQGVDALKPIDNSSAIGQELSAIADSLKTREEIEVQAYERRKKLAEDNIKDEEDRRRVIEDLERTHAFNMVEIERDKNSQIVAMRESVLGLSVELLAALGSRSKKFAQAAIVLEKAYAIQKVLIESKVAAMAALTPPPIGLGPVAGQALAAAITASGYTQAGLIGAIGAVQVADAGKSSGGGSSAVGGAFSSPTAAPVSSPQAQRVTQIYFNGPIAGDENLKKIIVGTLRQTIDNEDVVIISSGSRQAREIRGT